MKLIVGLGNPGKAYLNSRHNVGFCLVDLLSDRWQIELKRRKFQARYGSGMVGKESVVLLKPQTYMNLSGASVAEAMSFYQAEPADLLIAVDDMALPLGHLRLRGRGSAGGHNGIEDIISRLGHQKFSRLRLGIGPARPSCAVNHVLGAFDSTEQEVIEASLVRATTAAQCWLDQGVEKAMTEYNQKIEPEESA